MTKSELFKKAHKMTRTTIAKFGGNYLVTFAQALKELYKAVKTVRFQIKTWFLNKNVDKLTAPLRTAVLAHTFPLAR